MIDLIKTYWKYFKVCWMGPDSWAAWLLFQCPAVVAFFNGAYIRALIITFAMFVIIPCLVWLSKKSREI